MALLSLIFFLCWEDCFVSLLSPDLFIAMFQTLSRSNQTPSNGS